MFTSFTDFNLFVLKDFCRQFNRPLNENLLITCRTKPLNFLTNEEKDVWYWYCTNAVTLMSTKYRSEADRANNLFLDAVHISDEVFLFMQLRMFSKEWATRCLEVEEEVDLSKYDTETIANLKNKTPNHKLIDALFSEKIYVQSEMTEILTIKDNIDENLQMSFCHNEKKILNEIFSLSTFTNESRPKKSHSVEAMNEIFRVNRIFKYVRRTTYSKQLSVEMRTKFQQEYEELQLRKKQARNVTHEEKLKKKKQKREHYRELWDDGDESSDDEKDHITENDGNDNDDDDVSAHAI